MSDRAITINPATPRIGAFVSRIDITRPLSNLDVSTLHEALADHQVLFFRDQPFTFDSQKAFGRLFGDLHIHPNTPGPEGHPEILPIHADANSKRINAERWHSDVSCNPEPPLGSVLYLHTVPPVGGDTLFASMYAAYEALSPRMKAYLEGLTALHSGERSYRRTLFLGFRPDLLTQARQRWRSLAGGVAPTDPTVVINEGLASAVLHTGEALSGRVKVSERVKEQRTLEVLLLLAEAGAAPLRPDLKSFSSAEAVRSLVRDDPASNWTAAGIAASLGMSESTLRRSLRQDGTNFREIVGDERMRLAHAMLAEGRSVAEAAAAAGYASLSHFAKRFFANYGRLPSHRLTH